MESTQKSLTQRLEEFERNRSKDWLSDELGDQLPTAIKEALRQVDLNAKYGISQTVFGREALGTALDHLALYRANQALIVIQTTVGELLSSIGIGEGSPSVVTARNFLFVWQKTATTAYDDLRDLSIQVLQDYLAKKVPEGPSRLEIFQRLGKAKGTVLNGKPRTLEVYRAQGVVAELEDILAQGAMG